MATLKCPSHISGTVEKWFAKKGDSVLTGQKLVQIKAANGEITTINSKMNGTVSEVCVDSGLPIKQGEKLAIIKECTHDITFHDICASCGIDIKTLESKDHGPKRATFKLIPSRPALKATYDEAYNYQDSHISQLLAARKLILVLDLDSTLIHATVDRRGAGCPDIDSFDLPGLVGKVKISTTFYIKQRPHLDTFLSEAFKYFDIYMYTAGNRSYAMAVADVIDKSGIYFKNGVKILSADESLDRINKKLENLFPLDQSMAVVVDDRADVWSCCKSLIRIHPFVFFTSQDVNIVPKLHPMEEKPLQPPAKESASNASTGEENSSSTATNPSPESKGDNAADSVSQPTETSTPEPPEPPQPQPESICKMDAVNDKHLLTVLKSLKKVHTMFYEEVDAGQTQIEVGRIMFKFRSQILSNVHILFSHVIPTNQPCRASVFWGLSLGFGARCYEDFNDKITHVVTAHTGTDKVKRAESFPHVQVVKLEWLVDTFINCHRMKESMYTVSSNVALHNSPKPQDHEYLLTQLYNSYVWSCSSKFGEEQWENIYGDDWRIVRRDLECVNKATEETRSSFLSASLDSVVAATKNANPDAAIDGDEDEEEHDNVDYEDEEVSDDDQPEEQHFYGTKKRKRIDIDREEEIVDEQEEGEDDYEEQDAESENDQSDQEGNSNDEDDKVAYEKFVKKRSRKNESADNEEDEEDEDAMVSLFDAIDDAESE